MGSGLASDAELEALAPGVTSSAEIADALADARASSSPAAMRVGDRDVWGLQRSRAHALLVLHDLSMSGAMARANLDDDGEHEQIIERSKSGELAFKFAAPKMSDDQLSRSRWGRMYLDLWRAKRPLASAMVIR